MIYSPVDITIAQSIQVKLEANTIKYIDHYNVCQTINVEIEKKNEKARKGKEDQRVYNET